MFKITSQYQYDYKDQVPTEVSDEILTVEDEAYTIRELMARAVANTLPDIEIPGYYDDEDIDIDDYEFFNQPKDLVEFMEEKNRVLDKIKSLESKLSKIREESERVKNKQNFPETADGNGSIISEQNDVIED